ncbi:autotransporter domain-containing protein [Labrys sedimenti]|uniref:autotransporter domain-containing protein n=1 Tax=Labrys sedimenti TaxID=3106036 RepID=UPI002ACAF2DD|nr:autotransporter domain-containing protein [Labrys sp. ZIDIC5]MDZ5452017.1 autotransporter domain-containing protein [Labrys sp. ZIDIC5]
MLALLCSTALPAALLPTVASMPAKAQALHGATGGQARPGGGSGGNAGEAGSDGTGANAGAGGAAGTVADPDGHDGDMGEISGGGGGGGYSNIVSGDISTDIRGGNGGDGGQSTDRVGGGGAGGDGVRNLEATPFIHVSATVRGGNGGNIPPPSSSAGGGGGAGIVLENTGTLILDSGGKAIGGKGGGDLFGEGAFSGGGGGAGVILNAGGQLTVQTGAGITGGAGGALASGGAGVVSGGAADVSNMGEITGGAGGLAAPAGAGVRLLEGGSVINGGTIQGGDGDGGGFGGSNGSIGGIGSGGAPGFQPNTVTGGFGAAGIVGANIIVMNAGTIAGGTGGGRANAITFTGGDNTLYLRNGSVLIGNVVVAGGTGSLVLGDYETLSSTPAFDVSKLVDTATAGASDEFVGFTDFAKIGDNAVTLTGIGAQNWRIEQGTLIGTTDTFGGNISFGNPSGGGGGIVVFDQDFDGTYAGTIATNAGSTGGFTKLGTGTLTLTGHADIGPGPATISEGRLDVAGTLVSGVGSVDYAGGAPDGTASVRVAGAGAGWTNGGDLTVGSTGVGALDIAAGGVVSSNGGVIGAAVGSTGKVTVTGPASSWTLDNSLLIGMAGDGTLAIAGGAKVLAGGPLGSIVGFGPGSSGAVTVTGTGSLWNSDTGLFLGIGGTGTLTVTDGGTARTGGIMGLAAAAGSTGTINIGARAGEAAAAAGVIDAASIQFGDGAGTLVFNHTGTDYAFAASLQNAPQGTGAGTHRLDHLAGTTRLTGDSSTFDGITTVSGGKLSVDGALGGTVNVVAGGTLGGSGTVGAAGITTTIADGGHIAPGNSVGRLHVAGNLALASGSVLDFELGSPGASAGAPGTSDHVDVAGDLTLDGTVNLAQSGDPSDGAAGVGYYRLMTYGGTLTDKGLEIGTTSVAGDYEIQAGGGNVDLFVAAGGDDTLQHWQGGNGTWNATNAQWLNQGSTVPVTWAGNHAVFKNEPGGFGGGTISVEGTQSFKGLQFVDNGYRLEGSGTLQVDGSERADGNAEVRVLANTTAHIATTIGGTGGISKTEGGTLVLEGNNSYQGGTRLLGGTLSVSSDANLGAASGALTFNGGTLQVTGTDFTSTTRNIIWGDKGGGFDIAAGANVFTVSQTLTGLGDLIKTGAGTLKLSGVNSYGNTGVAQGTLIGNASSISGNIANAGTVVFDQAADGSFAGNIGGMTGTAGTMIKQGAGNLALTGSSILDWSIQNGGLSTAAERFGGDAAIGLGTSLTFDQTANAAYAGVLTGTGRFVKAGTGALLYDGDSSDFAGTTDITAGALIVGSDAAHAGAMLGGSFNVQEGGTLGGHGTLGSGAGSTVTIASGGTLSPGNSIGTLTVDGNLVFDTGSTYRAEINPGLESDLVDVSGIATINGGTVYALKAGGVYTPGSRWTIIDAAGGVSGTFDTFDQNMPFVDLSLTYDANHVYIDAARNEVAFCDVAVTRNQCATGNGLESTGVGNPVYDAVAGLPDENSARRALDQLSGEIHASAKTALIEDSRFIRDASVDRIRAAFGTVGASSAPIMAYGQDGARLVAPTTQGLAVWGQGFGAWGHVGGDGNAAKLETSTGGFLVGADAPAFDNWRFGVLAGYSRTTFKVRDRASSGDSDNYHLGLYGGSQWGALGLRTGVAYTWHDMDIGRSVSFPGFSESLKSKVRAGTFQAFGDLGYRIDTSIAAFEPFANLAYVSLDTGGFTERGGAAALHADSQTTSTAFTTLGLRASTSFDLFGIATTVRGSLGWRHAYGDVKPLSIQAFAGGAAFTVAGVPIARNAAVVSAGIDMAVSRNTSLGLSYDGQFASSAQQHGFKANLSVRF